MVDFVHLILQYFQEKNIQNNKNYAKPGLFWNIKLYKQWENPTFWALNSKIIHEVNKDGQADRPTDAQSDTFSICSKNPEILLNPNIYNGPPFDCFSDYLAHIAEVGCVILHIGHKQRNFKITTNHLLLGGLISPLFFW